MVLKLKNAGLVVLTMILAGCSIIPVPLTKEEIHTQAVEDKSRLTADQEPVTRPISLYEAMARALSYNLDLRLELIKKTLAKRQLDVARYEQLPELVGSLGYDSRSNFSGAFSRSLTTGLETLESSTASDRDVLTADLSLSWNVLDFGVSYYRAQQAADRVLISEEQKRNVINRILQDVRIAYWRAVTSDRLLHRLEQLLERVNKALEDSKQVEQKRLDTPITALRYQRELIDMKRRLQELYRNLSISKIQLASLMNLSMGTDYELDLSERSTDVPTLKYSPQLLEQLALENRSELREIAYEKRINANETKAALLELLPGINLNIGTNYDSNSFLFNSSWLNYGALISWNLMNFIKYPTKKKETEAREQVIDAQRLALSMAILTQVHVGLAQYEHAKIVYWTATDYKKTQLKILDQLISAASTQSINQLILIREEMNTLLAEVRDDIAYADLEYAYANTYASIGIDAIPNNIDFENLESITESIKDHFDNLKKGNTNFSMKIEKQKGVTIVN